MILVSVHEAAIAAQLCAGAAILLARPALGRRNNPKGSHPLTESQQPEVSGPPIDRSIVRWFLPT